MAATRAGSRPRELPRVWPFAHVRLVVFFCALAVAGGALGALWLGALGDPVPLGRARWVVAAVAVGVAALGLAGVLAHRLRVLPLRWAETESYLRAIERESEKYRLLMEGAADMLLILDPAGELVREWNASAREGLALPAPGGAALRLERLVEPDDLPRLRAALDEAATTGGQATPLGELLLRGLDGARLAADARLASIALEGERVVLLALRDRTRQKAIEKELAVRERLSSIGLLTAGVAHEINNPLEGIANYLRLAEREGLDPAARADALQQVRHGFTRIRDIVRDLLRFARPSAEDGFADLALVVERATKLAAFSGQMREVEVATDGLDAPLELVGDAGRLEQVLVNLLLNAAAAMEGRGRIALSARRTQLGSGAAAAELVVRDEGPGIPPEHLERLFDPFFTTRGGTGLGLSVSYGIVRAYGGELVAANHPEGGATFTLRLPLRADA